MRLDRATLLQYARALMLLGLGWELFSTLQYPAGNIKVAENIYAPLWHSDSRSTSPIYSSTALLRRCQSAMAYNISSGDFETGPLSLWISTEAMFAANPAAGWATWQQLVVTAKNPWAAYWASIVVPESWHIMPRIMRENLQLFEEAVPVLTPNSDSGSGTDEEDKQSSVSSSGQQNASAFEELDGEYMFVSRWVSHCSAPVNHTTLKPIDVVYCTVTERGNHTRVEGSFQVQHSRQRQQQLRKAAASPLAGKQQQQQQKAADEAVFGVGPMGKQLQHIAHWLGQYRPLQLFLKVVRYLWEANIPTGSLTAMKPLLAQLRVLELEWEWEVTVVYCLALVVCFRNWVYLVCVAYKIARRLALLAFHGPLDRFNGAILTFVGVWLGLWQTMGNAILDLALDVAMVKLQLYALSRSVATASWLWYLSFEWGLFELRALMRVYKLAHAAWTDIKALVLNPQAIVVAGQPFDQPPKRTVASIGPWPPPLAVPDEVDDLSVSEVPRGFICPITQGIMRQPALLLHDATVTPSTYEKEAINQWLSEHSSDPKNPGSKLNMKSVKLVYNGDLARAIEDWVAATMASRRTASQQASLAMLEQRLAQIKMRAQATLRQQQQAANQQQQQEWSPQQWQQQSPVQPSFLFGQQAQQQDAGGPSNAAEGAGGVDAQQQQQAQHPAGTDTGGAGPSGNGSAAGALNLMRQSSEAIALVASMDIPTVAAAGLASLADTTRRITTRAAARRLHQQHMQQLQQLHQPQQHDDDRALGIAPPGDGHGSGNSNSSEAHTTDTGGDIAWGSDEVAGTLYVNRRRSTRVRYRARRQATPAPE